MKPLRPETLAQLERLLDSDLEWWPFAAFRPAPEQRFSAWRSALLASLYTLPATVLGALLGRGLGDAISDAGLLGLAAGVWAVTFLAFWRVVAPFWNRRSERLRVLWERRRAWAASVRPLPGGQADDERDAGEKHEADEKPLGQERRGSGDAAEPE